MRLVNTRDVDEARLAFSHLFAESTIEPKPGFGCAIDVVSFSGIHVVSASWDGGGHTYTPVVEASYIFACPADNPSEVAHEGETFGAIPGRQAALFSANGSGVTIRNERAFAGRSLSIGRGALEAHLRALSGVEVRAPIHFAHAVQVDSGPGAAVFDVVQTFRREVARPGASPLLLSALRDALFTSLLTNTVHSASSLVTRPPKRAAPGCVRRAEDFIDAHAGEPITLVEIASAAGVSVRSLQATFKAYRDVSPMERLRERRFTLARERLLRAAPGTTVLSVVTALGLGNPGRFSGLYKQRFGETPSETLARVTG